MDGWSLAAKVRALHANAPVIYASGNAELQELLPRSEFIQKPYRSEHIFRVAADLGVDLPRTALE
jgi:CheY-like chemotaxis protein